MNSEPADVVYVIRTREELIAQNMGAIKKLSDINTKNRSLQLYYNTEKYSGF